AVVDDDQAVTVEGDADAVERAIDVRQRLAHARERFADLGRLEAAVDELLGRLDAHQILEREHRLAGPPRRRPDEPHLRPVAQLALDDVEDLGRPRERVRGFLHQNVASTSTSMKTLAPAARIATCVLTSRGAARQTRAASRFASSWTRLPTAGSA